jgi:hypothetical protein
VAELFASIYLVHNKPGCEEFDVANVLSGDYDAESAVVCLEKKETYRQAVRTIRRFAVGDAFVRKVKEIAWRPSGRLAMNLVNEVCVE